MARLGLLGWTMDQPSVSHHINACLAVLIECHAHDR